MRTARLGAEIRSVTRGKSAPSAADGIFGRDKYTGGRDTGGTVRRTGFSCVAIGTGGILDDGSALLVDAKEPFVLFNPEEFLAHAAWMERLAQSLVQDAATADDIVQQTWLKVAERPPDAAVPKDGWLRTVVRNFAYRRHREDRRRASREGLVARPESLREGPAEIVERAELQHQISGLVLELEEPYRSTVLLRFLEDLTPGEIARRHGVPETTVRSRITRALEKLRLRLDHLYHGDRVAWSTIFVPVAASGVAGFLESPAAASAASGSAAAHTPLVLLSGGLTMTNKILLAASVLAFVAFLAGVGAGRVLWPSGSDANLLLQSKAEIERLKRDHQQVLADLDRLRAASRDERDSFVTQVASLEEELAGLHAAPATGREHEDDGRSRAEEALLRLLGGEVDLAGLWQVAHKQGDLNAMEEIVQIVELVYTLRLRQAERPPEERKKLQRELDINGFRKGYTRFARGDMEGAREAYRGHLDYLNKRGEEMEAAGESLDGAVEVYRMRSESGLEILQELGGRPAPVELDLGDTWVTEKRTAIRQSSGKALGLVFRRVGDGRSREFLGGLSQACVGDPGVELVNVSFQEETKSLEEQMAGLRAELFQLGFTGAAGLDPDTAGKSLFGRFHANIGSATFVIINVRGEVVWHQQDPTQDHVRLARELLCVAGK